MLWHASVFLIFFLKMGRDVIFVKLLSRLFQTPTPFTESECLTYSYSSDKVFVEFRVLIVLANLVVCNKKIVKKFGYRNMKRIKMYLFNLLRFKICKSINIFSVWEM